MKSNQPSLFKRCEEIAREEYDDDYDVKVERIRNRNEYRKVSVYHNPKFNDKVWDKYITALVSVRRDVEEFNTKKKANDWRWEVSFYVSTKKFSAKKFNEIIRGHWGIENRNHYVKDVSMNEDKSRIRNNPQNFARLRSFALNLMRINNSTNIKGDLYKNALNINRVLSYKSIVT